MRSSRRGREALLCTVFPRIGNKEAEEQAIYLVHFLIFPENPGDPHKMLRLHINPVYLK